MENGVAVVGQWVTARYKRPHPTHAHITHAFIPPLFPPPPSCHVPTYSLKHNNIWDNILILFLHRMSTYHHCGAPEAFERENPNYSLHLYIDFLVCKLLGHKCPS